MMKKRMNKYGFFPYFKGKSHGMTVNPFRYFSEPDLLNKIKLALILLNYIYQFISLIYIVLYIRKGVYGFNLLPLLDEYLGNV
jgi:hypothetical protein